MPPDITLVVPCYDEAQRLRPQEFQRCVAAHPQTRILLVNDGSHDETLALLRKLEDADPEHFGVLDLQPNRGKAEAVRQGMLAAFGAGARYAGYWDADLATPLDELPEFIKTLDRDPALVVVMGARVNLLGRSIRRNPARHYLGRVFATVVSSMLRLPVYDTQCGAKLFRCGVETEALFSEPFCANWVFDVELIARLIRARRATGRDVRDSIYELPLRTWHDVAGSKVRPADFLKAIAEVARIYRRYLHEPGRT